MNILEVKDFTSCKDKVKTEAQIWENLEQDNSITNNQLLFAKFPFADLINKKGVNEAQKLVSSIENEHSDKKVVFICQHIDISKINFSQKSIVFTPHATTKDNFKAIPHISKFDGQELDLNKEREIKYCFIGATWTHVSRAYLFHLFSQHKDFYLRDTGKWHFEKTNQDIINYEVNFSSILQKTKFSLCPRGTGPSTIRIWDSLALGCVPVLFGKDLKMPLSQKVNWDEVCIFVDQSRIATLHMNIKEECFKEKQIKGLEVFKKYFNIRNIHKSIELTI